MIATAERPYTLKQAPTENPAVLEAAMYQEKWKLLRNILKKYKEIQTLLNELSSFEYGIETHFVADSTWEMWMTSYTQTIDDLTMLMRNTDIYAEAIETFNGHHNTYNSQPSRFFLNSQTLYELKRLIDDVQENRTNQTLLGIVHSLKLFKQINNERASVEIRKFVILIQTIRQYGIRLSTAIAANQAIAAKVSLQDEIKGLL